jgi:hypothetical protein
MKKTKHNGTEQHGKLFGKQDRNVEKRRERENSFFLKIKKEYLKVTRRPFLFMGCEKNQR